MNYPSSLIRLLDALKKLPGIGEKSARRIAFYILYRPMEEILPLIEALKDVKQKIGSCRRCFNIAEGELCPVCSDHKRAQSGTICVVEEASDLLLIEGTNEYKGLYHVLEGAISPLKGITPQDLRIKELLQRVQSENIKEVILAMDTNVEGESTAMYLMKQLKPLGIRVTRLAQGLPLGSELEYTDAITMARALKSRVEMQ